MTTFKYAHYFSSDPDWERFSSDPSRPELSFKTEPTHKAELDIADDRRCEAIQQAEFAVRHPPESFGYNHQEEKIRTAMGAAVPVTIYRPVNGRTKRLPLLFVTHGGGWVQGTPITEEMWLLSPLFRNFDLLIVSVDYHLIPEHPYPSQVNDCWDAFRWVMDHASELSYDSSQVFLAGSSAGGCLAAVVSQKARDLGYVIAGVILNVPVTCHPNFFPRDQFEYTSYDQCEGTLLTANEMRLIWDVYAPGPSLGREPTASPLLGDLCGLPPHLVFVAGQDPLRDEGLAYVEALGRAVVNVKLCIYQGVPHSFGRIWELDMTKKFHRDLAEGFRAFLARNGQEREGGNPL